MNYTCTKCKKNLPSNAFNKTKQTKRSLTAKCRECINIWRRQYIKKNPTHITATQRSRSRKHTYVHQIKLQGCSVCGYKKCPAALIFHHKDPLDKTNTVANLVSKCATIEKIQAEIDKCILLCQNCHHELHHGEGKYGWNHRYLTDSKDI